MPYADVNGLHLYYEEHGEGSLAVLPGTTHMDLTRSTLLAPVIEAFLA
jgi:hypothetical protein